MPQTTNQYHCSIHPFIVSENTYHRISRIGTYIYILRIPYCTWFVQESTGFFSFQQFKETGRFSNTAEFNAERLHVNEDHLYLSDAHQMKKKMHRWMDTRSIYQEKPTCISMVLFRISDCRKTHTNRTCRVCAIRSFIDSQAAIQLLM